jgi:hypothetical protein
LVTSLRQNSPARASGAIIAPKPIAAANATADAVAAFKVSFIMSFPVCAPALETEMGCSICRVEFPIPEMHSLHSNMRRLNYEPLA